MASTSAVETRLPLDSVPSCETTSLPWVVYVAALASTSIVVGVIWDISWHRTIGRDTFWTPAHMAIYLGGLLAGLSGGWLILSSTFRPDPGALAGVGIWGFRGPLG